ncbi:MAG: zf-HC2 domain-containing protein [Spirochaetia bacterium]|nr:zf-HC2 domain-containing protein [Spirochaetia bacterium]
MCPDDELLSAYCDGEVPSPWKERIEAHAAVCAKCSERIRTYAELHAMLNALDTAEEKKAFDAARQRVFTAIQSRQFDFSGKPSRTFGSRISEFWTRPVVLPMPVAAAALVVVAFLGGLSLGVLNPRAKDTRVLASAVQTLPASNASFDSILQFAESQTSPQTVTIRVQKDALIIQQGTPVIVTLPSNTIQEVSTTTVGGIAK